MRTKHAAREGGSSLESESVVIDWWLVMIQQKIFDTKNPRRFHRTFGEPIFYRFLLNRSRR